MGENTFGRKKAAASDFSQPSLVSPTTPSIANPVRGFGLPTHDVIQKANEVSTDTQETSEHQVIQEKPLGHDISRISFHRPQAKLTVGEPGDKYEQEADMMAHKVMSMSASTPDELQTKPLIVQTQATSQQEEEIHNKSSLQSPSNSNLEVGESIESQLNNSKGSGTSLADEVRAFMEPRFGADFSQVRVHTNSEAVQMNQELGAQAFTYGSNVYFGAGKAPGNNELTAHELTHVVQQTNNINNSIQRQDQSPGTATSGTTTPLSNNEAIRQQLTTARQRLMEAGGVYFQRSQAVSTLMEYLDETSSPTISDEAIKAAVQSVLSSVAGFLGGAIGMGVATLAASVQKFVADTVQSQISTFVQQAYSQLPVATTPSKGLFLETQLGAINREAQAAGDALASQESRFYQTPDGLEQARQLVANYTRLMNSAFDRQYVASTAAWARLVDMGSRLTDRSWGSMDTTAAGILGIDVDYADDNPAADMRITGVHLDGLPETVLTRLRQSNETIGSLIGTGNSDGMTIRVIQEYAGGYLMGTVGTRRTRVALSSTPSNRGSVVPVLTGTEGMWMLERGRRRYGLTIRDQHYDMVPIVGAIIMAREVMPIPLRSLVPGHIVR